MFCSMNVDIGCKVQPGDTCKISTQCPDDFMCLDGSCIPKPKEKEELQAVSFHQGRLCFNEHPFVFADSKFIFSPKHWKYENTLSIVEHDQTTIILTSTSLDFIRGDKIKSSANKFNFVQIFEFDGDLYAITRDGFLFFGNKINKDGKEDRKEDWQKISFFRGRDVNGVCFQSWIPTDNGFILHCSGSPSLRYTTKKVSENVVSGDWSFVNLQHLTKYHGKVSIELPEDQHATLFDGRQNIELGNILDAEFLPNGDVLILYPKGSMAKLSLSDMHLLPIHGKGTKFIKTRNNVWMTSRYHCIDI